MTDIQRIPVCVPSYRAYNRLTDTFLPSFAKYIQGQGRHHYTLVLNCEGYTDNQLVSIRSLCDQLRIDYILVCKEYPKPSPLAGIRHDTSALVMDHPLHLLCDDDFKFKPGSATAYDTAVDYMIANEQCGMVQCKSFLGGSKWGDTPCPAFGTFAFIAQGLMVRMIGDTDCPTVFPSSVLDTSGRFEDIYAGFHYWTRGFFVAKAFNVPTLHNHSPWDGDRIRQCKEGCQAVSLDLNGKNPTIVASGMGAAINSLLGDHFYTDGSSSNMKRMLNYRPKQRFWKAYVEEAIRRFGNWALAGADKKQVQRGYSTELSKLEIMKT